MEEVAELRYDKLEEIGIGEGMNSKVYRVFDPQIGGEVAVKEIPKESFGNKIATYFAEAHTMFAVAHAHVVPVRFGCTRPDHVALAMPYYKNGSLARRIAKDPLSLITCLRVGQGVLSGLAQIHMKRFLHLDVRPPNVLFDLNWEPSVADFGQSRSIDNAGIVTAPETYHHAMPPETLNKGIATVASDVYQAGMLLYRALNGEGHYAAQLSGVSDNALSIRIESGKFPDRDRFLPHIPKRLKTIVRKAMSIDPAKRYQSANEMADALAGVDLALDWEVSNSVGLTRWVARRKDLPSFVVKLALQDWDAKWEVSVSTDNNGTERAKGKSLYWRESLSLAEANRHLKDVFAELS